MGWETVIWTERPKSVKLRPENETTQNQKRIRGLQKTVEPVRVPENTQAQRIVTDRTNQPSFHCSAAEAHFSPWEGYPNNLWTQNIRTQLTSSRKRTANPRHENQLPPTRDEVRKFHWRKRYLLWPYLKSTHSWQVQWLTRQELCHPRQVNGHLPPLLNEWLLNTFSFSHLFQTLLLKYF